MESTERFVFFVDGNVRPRQEVENDCAQRIFGEYQRRRVR